MKTLNKPFLALTALAFALSLAAADAGARERHHDRSGDSHRHVDRGHADGKSSTNVSGTTADGRSFERHSETVRNENGYTHTDAGTLPNGKAWDRTATMTRDKEAGTWSKDISGTTPSGKSFSSSVKGEKTEDGAIRTATHSGPNGGTAVKTTTVTRNEDGSVSRDTTRSTTPPTSGGNGSDGNGNSGNAGGDDSSDAK